MLQISDLKLETEPKRYTDDTFLDGRIRVKQNAAGYRFSLDAVILAGHVVPNPGASVVDIGTGCGIIPLILAYRYPAIRIQGLEIQPPLAELAKENVKRNNMEARITIQCDDAARAAANMPAGRIDLVTCNPPFRQAASGRINPHPERAIARHEIKITLTGITAVAAKLLRPSGEFATIYPAARLTDLVTTLRQAGIEPKLLRMIHSRARDPAKLVLLKGYKNGRPGLAIPAPLIIYHDDRTYTSEILKMFAP